MKNSPIITIFTVLAQGFFSAVVLLEFRLNNYDHEPQLFIPFAAIVVVVLSIFALISITQVVDTAKKSAQATILKAHLHTVDELITTLQAERHEYTRHIQTVQAMIFLEETEKAQEYIDGVAQRYWGDDGITYLGEPLLTGMISSKRSMAASMGIDFAFAFKCDPRRLPLEPWDLCSVMGNLLDNAIEAAILEEDNKRSVGIELKDEDDYYNLYVYNTGTRIKNPEKIFLAGYTSKGSQGRGYGLYIVKQLVQGCGGSLEVFTVPRTTFVIHFPKEGLQDGKANERNVWTKSRQTIELPGDTNSDSYIWH